jgi:hypothetical protein
LSIRKKWYAYTTPGTVEQVTWHCVPDQRPADKLYLPYLPLFTLSRSSLPTLKKGSLFGLT